MSYHHSKFKLPPLITMVPVWLLWTKERWFWWLKIHKKLFSCLPSSECGNTFNLLSFEFSHSSSLPSTEWFCSVLWHDNLLQLYFFFLQCSVVALYPWVNLVSQVLVLGFCSWSTHPADKSCKRMIRIWVMVNCSKAFVINLGLWLLLGTDV